MNTDKSNWATVREYAAGDSRRSWWPVKLARRVGKRATQLLAETGRKPGERTVPRRVPTATYPPDVLEQAYRWVRNNSPDEWPTPSADK